MRGVELEGRMEGGREGEENVEVWLLFDLCLETEN